MVVLLIVIFLISAVLLNLLILVQDDQGEGLGGLFGGGSAQIGSRKGNVLTRVTTVLATLFLVTALAVAWMNRSLSTGDLEAKARIRELEAQQGTGWYVKSSGDESSGESTTNADTDSDSVKGELVPAEKTSESGESTE